MGYYPYWGWHDRPPSYKDRLSRLFGAIYRDIQSHFFNLSGPYLEALFREYGRMYGSSAEGYARRAFPGWKSGKTGLSGKTVERLIDLVPSYLSFDERYRLIRKLRAHCLPPREKHRITAAPTDWKQTVEPIIQKLIEKSGRFEFPEQVREKATWLAGGEAAEMNRMLAMIEEEEARIKISYLPTEFKRIELLLENSDSLEAVDYTIKIPQGSIYIHIPIKRRGILFQLLASVWR